MSGFVYGLTDAHARRPARRRWMLWSRLLGPVAAGAGHALRFGRRLALHVPGVGGAGLVAVGLGLAWLPLGVVAAGVFLLLLDRRTA